MSVFVFVPGAALLLGFALVVSAIATIVATVREAREGVYIFKPLTTLLIIALAWHQPASIPPYRTLVIAGLVFSLFGDVFLMLPRDRFVAGLVSFLIAHLLYIPAFAQGGFRLTIWLLVPFIVYAAILPRILLPHVPAALKVPVIVYAAALLVMAWQAAERGAAAVPGGLLAAIGGVLFVASDSALALNRFARPFRGADAPVLATYFAAQTLIALSIR
ncbi:MAG TPA: lysoplasmalogenase [Longimicrobium sp.]|nr:lysoplasmalogenase [Longimicrobium sp.]